MPRMKPVSVSARGMRLEPTAHTMLRVMVWIAPVWRSASAMMEPSTMTTPMDPNVEPKPRSKAAMKLFCCTPGMMPKMSSGSSKARKTCQRHLAMRNSSRTMTPAKAASASRGFVVTAVDGSMRLPLGGLLRQVRQRRRHAPFAPGYACHYQPHLHPGQRAGER